MNKLITLQAADGLCQAHLVTSDRDSAAHPGVLLFMDAIGVRPALLRLAQRIADAGYTLLLPNLFYRQHPLPLFEYPPIISAELLREKIFPTVLPWLQATTPEMVKADGQAYLQALRHSPRVSAGPMGAVGYCMGGAQALRVASAFPDEIRATVVLHAGRLATDQPDSPHLSLARVKGGLYFGHADKDQSMPAAMIAKLEAGLKVIGSDAKSELYAGAPHGWTQSDLPAYRAEQSERAFQRTLETLQAMG